MTETRHQHWLRRSLELNRKRKAELCTLYRRLGGLGGIHPPEKWRKDEVITSIVEMEWDRLPADQKKPDPPRLTPPCDECGQGQNATAHHYGGDHHYRYTHNPDAVWVPESEAEAARLEQLERDQEPEPEACGTAGCGEPPSAHLGWNLGHLFTPQAEVQPTAADATADTPLPVPYAYRIDYPAPHRDDGPQMMSFGTRTTAAHGVRTMHQAATEHAADTRVGHSYWGPLTVYVWKHRGDDEHYRTPPPATAYRLELGDQVPG